MHVLIDDCRDGGDVIIRNPNHAIHVLRRLGKQVESVSWDNDMGYGWELEGRNLLKQYLTDCRNQKHWPTMFIVTSNTVAAKDMEVSLKQAGYKFVPYKGWIHS